MENTARIMLALIKSQLKQQPLDETVAQQFSTVDLPLLYRLSKAHDMAHLVGAAIRQNGLPVGDCGKEFRSHTFDAAYRSEKITAALEQVSTHLQQAQISFVLLKGAVIRQLYPQAWMRTSCDIDLLVKPEDAGKAIEQLCQRGYTRKPDTSVHDHVLIAPNGVAVELHHTLTQDDCIPGSDALLENVWSYAQPEEENSCSYRLTNEFFWVYHLAHMARHFLHGGCGVRPFADLWLMKNKMPCNTALLQNLLTQTKLSAFYDGVMALADVWFADVPHSKETLLLEQFILTGGVFGTQKNAAQVSAGQGDTKLRSFLKVMFLPRKDLQVLYPALEQKPGLYPYYQLKRWCGIFSKERRTSLQKRTNARDAVTQEQQTEVTHMLRSLGFER